MTDSRTTESPDTVGRSRLVLAFGLLLVLAALAGCSAPGSITLSPADDARIGETYSQPVNPGTEHGGIITEVVETGAANDTAASIRALDPGDELYRYDGAYYRVSRTVVDEEEAYFIEFAVDYNPSDAADPDAVRFSTLTPADRRVLDELFPPPTDRRQEGYDVGNVGVYTPDELTNSTLVERNDTSEQVVIVDGERYQVRAQRGKQTTRKTYRYTAEEVFATDEAYADHLRAKHRFTLSSMPAEERKLLRQAADGGYTADGEDDTTFQSVVERFREQDAIRRTEFSGEWLVRWQGQTYLVEIRFGDYTRG